MLNGKSSLSLVRSGTNDVGQGYVWCCVHMGGAVLPEERSVNTSAIHMHIAHSPKLTKKKKKNKRRCKKTYLGDC